MKAIPMIALSMSLLLSTLAAGQQHSELWGQAGENWSPDSRLPDWSFAGYERGEQQIPTPQPTVNVRRFGARGDGQHDDTQAFKQAIAAIDRGVVYIPAGRYLITDIIRIDKPEILLRGEGETRTTLYFPRTLTDIEPNWGATTGGRRTSNYSWSGGFIRIEGSNRGRQLGSAGPAKRGDNVLPVENPRNFEPGMEVILSMSDDSEHSLTQYIYAGDAGPIQNMRNNIRPNQVFRVLHVDRPNNRILLDRPLRFDVESRWEPTLQAYTPSVTHVGIEHLAFEFLDTPYEGHFTELGHNGIAMSNVAHCWVRHVRFLNAESGIFLNGHFCTLDQITFFSERRPDRGGNRGHHAIMVSGGDNLTTRFDFRVQYIHDITVTRGSIGNVFSDGKGVNVNFDHHRRGPYENLFTNIDVGEGSRVWASGGGQGLGKHCAARGTFWNIRSRRPINRPGGHFAPDMINIIGIHTQQEARTDSDGVWFETIRPDQLRPQNIHEAQRERRLNQR